VKRILGKVHLPGYTLVFVAEKNLKPLGAKVFGAPGAVIYQKPRA
jgi:hypothetical protein